MRKKKLDWNETLTQSVTLNVVKYFLHIAAELRAYVCVLSGFVLFLNQKHVCCTQKSSPSGQSRPFSRVHIYDFVSIGCRFPYNCITVGGHSLGVSSPWWGRPGVSSPRPTVRSAAFGALKSHTLLSIGVMSSNTEFNWLFTINKWLVGKEKKNGSYLCYSILNTIIILKALQVITSYATCGAYVYRGMHTSYLKTSTDQKVDFHRSANSQ